MIDTAILRSFDLSPFCSTMNEGTKKLFVARVIGYSDQLIQAYINRRYTPEAVPENLSIAVGSIPSERITPSHTFHFATLLDGEKPLLKISVRYALFFDDSTGEYRELTDRLNSLRVFDEVVDGLGFSEKILNRL